MKLLEEAGCDPAGKHAVVIGRSNIVGKPQALMLLEKNASVTIVHSRTTDLAEHTRRADILVAAVGRAKMVKADMVKPGAVVIDVGMNRDENGKLIARTSSNWLAAKAFWSDIDCGHTKALEGKGYATQKEGAKALLGWCKSKGLPFPMLVNSGRGIHAYWLSLIHI